MIKDEAKFTIRINRDILKRLSYIADYYGRSVNGQLYWLAKQEIARFEKEVGKIEEKDLEE